MTIPSNIARIKWVLFYTMVGVAQQVRAPGCGPGGRGFNSHRSPKPFSGFTPNPISAVLPVAGSLIKNELSGNLDLLLLLH